MATVKEAADNFNKFVSGFEDVILGVMNDNRAEVRELITEQLFSGVNGNDQAITPNYLNDPWFSTDEAGKWKGNAKGYAKWKKKITAPARSFQGYPERNQYTPNLIITGEFYDSIRVSSSNRGLKIETRGSDIGPDIERKYGSIILGMGSKSIEYFIKYRINPVISSYYARFGM